MNNYTENTELTTPPKNSTIDEILNENPRVTIRQEVSVKIEDDEFAESPRDNQDHLGRMVCSDRNYRLGDERLSSCENILEYIASELGVEFDEDSSKEDLTIGIKEEAFIAPLSLYEHSGISISMGTGTDAWDSRNVGYIYIEKSKVDEIGGDGTDEEKAISCMQAETKEYDIYLRGENYRGIVSNSIAVVKEEDGETLISEELYPDCVDFSFSSSDPKENYINEYIHESSLDIEGGINLEDIKEELPSYISTSDSVQVSKNISTLLLDLPKISQLTTTKQTFKKK